MHHSTLVCYCTSTSYYSTFLVTVSYVHMHTTIYMQLYSTVLYQVLVRRTETSTRNDVAVAASCQYGSIPVQSVKRAC